MRARANGEVEDSWFASGPAGSGGDAFRRYTMRRGSCAPTAWSLGWQVCPGLRGIPEGAHFVLDRGAVVSGQRSTRSAGHSPPPSRARIMRARVNGEVASTLYTEPTADARTFFVPLSCHRRRWLEEWTSHAFPAVKDHASSVFKIKSARFETPTFGEIKTS
jgi:hypothetical protein